MKLKQFDIDKLQPHPENYNKHPNSQLDELEKSLDTFEQYKNIVVWNGLIIAGNGLYEAAKRKGLKKIYAIDRSDLSESQAKALLIADNATSAISEPDLSQLKVLLDGLGDVDIPGVNDDFFESVGMEWDNENDDDDTPPDDFKEYDENIDTEHECPKCGYKWSSGK